MFRKIQKIALFVSTIVFFISCSPKKDPDQPLTEVKQLLTRQTDSLENNLHRLAAATDKGDSALLKTEFLKTRKLYKKLEWFCEYYAPGVSREINGPPLVEVETEETKSFEPSGLQVIEEFVYPYVPEEQKNLKREILSLQSSLRRFRVLLKDTEMTEAHVFDACKLEVFRIIICGISGFDTPLSCAGIDEASASINAVGEVLRLFGKNGQLNKAIDGTVSYLTLHNDFKSFDRMVFIRNYANVITKEIVEWQNALSIKPLETELALHKGAKSLFDKDVFNTDHFVNSTESMASPEKQALGKALFNDPIVSGSIRTCQSCHRPELAFTDGLVKSQAIAAGKFVKRNAPTLLYAGLQNAQFYDMRFQTLENQAMDVIANKDEMHGSVEEAATRLEKDARYYPLFKKAFPTMETELKPRFVMAALASYIRSLNPFNSRFDKFMRGDDKQMNQQELNGFNLFTGKAKCATCHFMPLFNGTAGPVFSNTEAEVIGTLKDPDAKKPMLDEDEGRYFWIKMDVLKYAFKTPTLRNVAKTAPYMHNGAYGTLEQVMDFYNKGGAAGAGIELPNQTLPFDKLNLSEKEIRDIISFLKTLDDQ